MNKENNNADFEYIKMDYSLEDPQARNKKVQEIIEQTPPERLTSKYLEKLADYIIFAMDKEEQKSKKIITDNRMVTVNKRETSFEGLAGKLENGEDGLYNMMTNDKNIIFAPKVEVTAQDIAEIPGMKELCEAIEEIERQAKCATGSKAFKLKQQAIEMRKDKYVLKNTFKKPIYSINLIKSMTKINLDEKITIDAEGNVTSNGIVSLINEKHVSMLLCNYSKLKEEAWDNFNSDIKWLMCDLDNLIEKHIKVQHPLYYDLIIYKIDGKQNAEIQLLLADKHGIKHSVEYLSALWRKKIPKLIAEAAQNEWLIWYFTNVEYGKWKKCSKCGQIKLAHNRFFSYNKTSKDGWYSICKCCRNKKRKE